ncbi:unnamed protein product [Somion occarium]|uniref:AAA+ ATPase domain-containing protein n=1 Tax=Somion occarium TaxID=3059160 RepID=A0ABP1EA28_9APHY
MLSDTNVPSLLVPDLVQSPWNFEADPAEPDVPANPLKIKIPPVMAPNTRSAARHRTNSSTSPASGSEYHESSMSMEADDHALPIEEEDEQPEPVYTTSTRGRRVQRKSYVESNSEDDPALQDDDDPLNIIDQHSDDPPKAVNGHDADADEGQHGRYQLRGRSRPQSKLNGTIVSDDEGEVGLAHYHTRSRNRRPPPAPETNGRSTRRSTRSQRLLRTRPSTRRTRSRTQEQNEDDVDYVDQSSSGSADADGSLDEGAHTSPEPEVGHEDEDKDGEGELDDGVEPDGRPYALRQRREINYAIPPPLEEMRPPPPKPKSGGGRAGGRIGGLGGKRSKAPGWSATGAELSRWMGGGEDSDSDYATRTPRKPFGVEAAGGGIFAGSAGGTGLFPGDLAAAAGTPSNLGKVGDASLADVDPLGVNQNVSFDDVGGLEEHVSQLKEMTLLPLLYPDLFKNLSITPPRGVLFHGPPGTGKTLLARALAASTRHDGRGVSFFMRKGADCLSKWVGEAERQLRLLFEEARNQQPSIIFFDEIDGLAPVRSSKQDQIHASIVSTLLALMDGMDGRGQVIVIGATNRPDAIDPALRRPGRFDREFYFPLPGLEAREKILSIMTKKWAGWEAEQGAENCRGLAKLTKGYGGADIRALCTEAALNAIQRRYPQIYRSTDRLLLDPDSIKVQLRDFMVSIKKLVPSSARAAAPEAASLPTQLSPLLASTLERVTGIIETVLPKANKRTALDEAEYEDEGEEGAMDREMMLQSMETLRVYRPRVVIYGPQGMGQRYIAAAALHHLEGYHVQSLDLASLMSDSTRTLEAAIIQLFTEAKRHQPSVVYIPSLNSWCSAVSEAARSTVRAMLDGLGPSDPILLLAVVDAPYNLLPKDVKAWFGPTRQNRAELTSPTLEQREEFFKPLLQDVRRPPTQFPDGVKRKKRLLEELPIAPPLEPRAPTATELAVQEANDQRVITLLKYRLGPILTELKRKFRRFTKRAAEEYNFQIPQPVEQVETMTTTAEAQAAPDGGVMEVVNAEHTQDILEQLPAVMPNGIEQPHVQAQGQLQQPPLFDMDLELMHTELYKSKYLTPDDFLDDIRKIVHNASVFANEDAERLYRAQAMLTAAEVSIQDFDAQFRVECQRTAVRERKRREAFRKEREKARDESAQNGVAHHPSRRSARAHGLQPELAITDPVRLERRLKRQRSAEANAEPSEEEEGSAGREAKRSRMSSHEAESQEGPVAGPLTPHKPHHGVRFADDVDGDVAMPSSPSPHANEPVPELQRIETPRGPVGFDSLLNPKHSPEESRPADNAFSYLTSIVTPQQSVSGDEHPPPPSQEVSYSIPPPHTPPSETLPQLNGILEGPELPLPNGDQAALDVIMEPERTPTPPPNFELDETLLSDLASKLRDQTDSLNVEQLEQLRATCLNCIWKRRQEWDRTPLVHELRSVANEFIRDVSEYDSDNDELPSPSNAAY